MPRPAPLPETPSWIAVLDPGAGPRYLQIVDQIERGVAGGTLAAGDRLPPQRTLARLLRVDLTTVTRAYDEARRRNLLEARGALGTYVAAVKVELTQRLDLSMNLPPPAQADMGELLKRGFAQVLLHNDADLLMTYHLGGGGKSDRAAGALWLKPMFGSIHPERIVACPGAQSALAALILALTGHGDTLAAEPIGYPGLRSAARHLGRKVAALATDADGMRPDALERAHREHGVRVLYLNPTLQNPTGATMPAQRRREIAQVAMNCDMRIIEDDPYWLLARSAPQPLALSAPERTYYLSTLSKCLTPGLRTAFVLLPVAQQPDALLSALRSISLMSSPLTMALATQWIHDGAAARLLAGVQAEARVRQDLARQVLSGPTGAPREGIHIWLALPSYWSARELARAALAQGLAVTPADAFHEGGNPPNAIRISLGGARERVQLMAGLRKLSDLLGKKPTPDEDFVV